MTDPIIINGAQWEPLTATPDKALEIHPTLQELAGGDYMVIKPKTITPEQGKTIEELIESLVDTANIPPYLKDGAKIAIHAIINYFVR